MVRKGTNAGVIYRYRPEIPEPVPSLSQHGAPIGGIWVQNNHDSSAAYVLWPAGEGKHGV